MDIIDIIKEREKMTDKAGEVTIQILRNTISEIKNMTDYLELEDIITNMIEELREKSLYSLISGEKYYVLQITKDLIKYDEEFKNFDLTLDKFTWIFRDFHDSQFDFDSFEDGVKKAMVYTKKYYEP